MTTQADHRDSMSYDQNYSEVSAYNERWTPQTHSPHAQSSPDDVDGFDTEDIGGMETPPTSFISTPTSASSVGYHLGYNNPNETTWIRNSYSSWLASTTDGSVSSSMVNCVHYNEQPDADNGSSVSMESGEQVLSALATSLAPARPQMIQLSNEIQYQHALVDSHEPSLQNRPGTPYEPSRRPITLDVFPLPSLNEEVIERSILNNAIKIERGHNTVISPGQVEPGFKEECASSSVGSSLGLDELGEHQHIQTGTVIANNPKSIIDSVHNILKNFPQHMLFLDTPCVVELRRRNHPISEASSPKTPRTPSPNTSVNEKKFAKLFTLWLRGSPSKLPLRQENMDHSRAATMSAGSSADSGVSAMMDPLHPDLAAFQRIFPTAQGWWWGVLYAHLVTYNYIRLIRVPSKQYRYKISPKASRTLGLSQRNATPIMTDGACDARLDKVEMELISCINWITDCMSGNRAVLMEQGNFQGAPERELVLIRSLAEIVAISEETLNK